MKKLICIAAFLLIFAQAGLADTFFQPQFSTVNVNDSFAVEVWISGVVSPWLGGYDIDIAYNPAILLLGAVNWADNSLGISIRSVTFSTGMVNVTETSLDSVADLGAAQSGNDPFRLFRLLFSQALAPGTSALTFQGVKLADGNGYPLAPGGILNGNVTVQGGSAVPEPTTMLLLGSGLIGLAGYGRKRFFKK